MFLGDSRPLPVDTERKRRVMVELAKRGMTITGIAARTGVSQQYASAIISGRKRYPGCEHKIADLLRLPCDYLFPPRSQLELDDMRKAEARRKLRGAA
jgi:hypothetical protein